MPSAYRLALCACWRVQLRLCRRCTSKVFADWGQVFPHAACVVTLVDRLVHRAEVIEIEAESYRLKEAKELSATRSKQRRTKKH
ncbi:ATP-binding protein [Sorangium sp. So ce341]